MRRFCFSFASFLFVLGLSLITIVGSASESEKVRNEWVEAQLISSHSTIKAGEPFYLGLQLTIDKDWHTYWINPGDSGQPTRLKLELPEGFSAGVLEFPIPKKYIVAYTPTYRQASLGYENSVLHTIQITPPANLPAGSQITLNGRADWLMCSSETCIPGKAELSLTLNTADASTPSPHQNTIEAARGLLPKVSAWPMNASLSEGTVTVSINPGEQVFPEGAAFKFFPATSNVFDLLQEPVISATSEGHLQVVNPAFADLAAIPTPFQGLLVVESNGSSSSHLLGYPATTEVTTSSSEPASGTTSSATSSSEADAANTMPFGGGLLGILLAAFLGGAILNIMPCVFPVISLKVMSFVGQAGEDRKKVLAHSLVFALGILVFFWLLTASLLVLRSMGSDDVGWGVQLRYPAFVIGLIFVMLIMALSLFGVFEIGTRLTSVGGDLANKSGYAGSFWSGALAVLLATPCSAPLMAPAIGFAFMQPAPITILVFTSLALGLAAPYFIFAIFPKLLDIIPAPGQWMETFKQFMGFPMLAVAVWLIGVLSRQLDIAGLQWALTAALLLALAAWIYGRFTTFDRSARSRSIARIVTAAVCLLSLFAAYEATTRRAPADATDIRQIVADHRQAGKHVFLDFTADWCITCKANESMTLKRDNVQQAFKDNNIEFVVADWSNPNPQIPEMLKEFGRAGIPLYVLYPADPKLPPIMLKEGIITSNDVMEAIAQLP